jgi:hypothetical protein
MKRLMTLLAALLSLAAVPVSADYRVDVLVFNHIDGEAESLETPEIRSFAELPRVDDVVLPDGMQVVAEMSEKMESIWRRFQRSGGYRPLLYLSWVQSKTDFHPPLRLHDDVVLAEALEFPSDSIIADLTANDPLAVYRVPFYQLDGSVQLRLSRFLHLELDLEYRQILPPERIDPGLTGTVLPPERIDPGLTGTGDPESDLTEPVAGGPLAPAADDNVLFVAEFDDNGQPFEAIHYEVRKLQQSRLIRTGETQYFDSPFIGVIAEVTEIR